MGAEVSRLALTDFLGNQYTAGDLVVYAAMSGRSINMVFGRVVEVYRVYRSEHYDYARVPLDDMGIPDMSTLPLVKYGKDEGQPVETYLRVKVQPLNSARWKQHNDKRYYVDTRSGKRIDPDRGKGLPHVLKESHYVFADGTEFDWAGQQQLWEQRHSNVYGRLRQETFEYYFRRAYHVNYEDTPGTHRFPLTKDVEDKTQLWWRRRTYQPWVEERSEGPKPVTLEITDNIVRWMEVEPGAEVRLPVP